MFNDKTNEVMKDDFDSLKNKYQDNLESMKCSNLVFDSVQL